MKTNTSNGLRLMAVSGLTMLLATGCSTYEQQSREIRAKWTQGNVSGAVQGFTAMTKKNEAGKDTIIWRLEQAVALRAAGPNLFPVCTIAMGDRQPYWNFFCRGREVC